MRAAAGLVALLGWLLSGSSVWASDSLARSRIDWPSWGGVAEVLLLANHNTRLVVLSTLVLGVASGLIGSFLLLRKRSLMGDALSHACLPGIGLAFAVLVALGGSGKSLPVLLLGATLTGLLGVGLVMAMRRTTRIKDDAAMGIVLSVFFGGGVAILGLVQTLPGASAAGLESFIYGKAASMVLADFVLICGVAFGAVLGTFLLLKELTLMAFDEGYATAQGMSVTLVDALLMGLVTAVTVVGLQAVGLILIIAFLITPAAAARFWTNDLRWMLVLAGIIGGVSGWLGASVSALLAGLPAGSVIVLTAAGIFGVSLVFGPARGVLRRVLRHRQLRRKVGRQHLLRAVYEVLEQHARNEGAPLSNRPVPYAEVLALRSWSDATLRRLIDTARTEDHVDRFDGVHLGLSEAGFGEATRTTRNHRLWELYLITHAEVAPAHVDRDADAVEHVLSPEMVRELEAQVQARWPSNAVPGSPHRLATEGPAR
ncbi:MAG: iron chelate uptake ABC transporter family permease subunit [Opitutales bacterium]